MISKLQNIFNNREIAIGIWVTFIAIIAIFTKPVKQFLKSVITILFCRKFVIFYIVFLFYLGLVISFSNAIDQCRIAYNKYITYQK